MKNIWKTIKKPILALAPMEDATDTVFRQIVNICGKPDISFTEFTSVEGLASKKGFEKVSQRLLYEKQEKPLIAQLWGANPTNFEKAARLAQKMKFDGVDLNMGCPQKNIIKTGACSALIKNRMLAKEIIVATKKGSGNFPLSIKTRLGFEKIDFSWIEFLLEQSIDALTIHLRTVREMSNVAAHWDEIARIVEIRDNIASDTLILGNGDVTSIKEAEEKAKKYKIDGVMIGREFFKIRGFLAKIKKM